MSRITQFALGALALAMALGPIETQAQAGKLPSLEELLEIPVTAASKRAQRPEDAPSMVSMITGEEIRRHGWRTLGEALATLPGIHVSYDRSYAYLGVRGFGRPGDYNSRILMLIDGFPINDGVYDQAPIGNDFPLDMALIDRIEYVPGPGSVLYGGNAFFGVLNVITRSGARFRPEVEIGAGDGRALDLRVSGGRRDDLGNDWLISASRARSRGKDLYFESYAAPGADAWSRGLDHAEADRLLLRYAKGGFQARLIANERIKGIPGGPWGLDLSEPGNRDREKHVLAAASYEHQVDADWKWMLRGYSSSYDYDQRARSAGVLFGDALKNRALGAEALSVSTALPGQTFVAGISWRDDSSRRQFNPSLDVNTPRRAYGLFLQDDWRATPWLTLSVGLRKDQIHAQSSHASASPRLAAIAMLAPRTTLKWIAGNAYRPPNGFETDYAFAGSNQANPMLQTERIRSQELGLEHRTGPDGRISASIYRSRIENLIALETDPVTMLQQHHNVGNASARGVELSGQGRWRNLRLRASAAWQDLEHESGAPIANAPKRLANVLVSGPVSPGMGLAWETQYLGPRTTDSGDVRTAGGGVGGHTISHATLSGDLGRGLSWRLRLSNVFDRRYASVVGTEFSTSFPGAQVAPMPLMPQDARTFFASLQWKF